MMLFMHHGHGDQLVHDDQDNLARHDDTTSPVGQAVSHDHSEERTQRVAAKEFQPQEETREGER